MGLQAFGRMLGLQHTQPRFPPVSFRKVQRRGNWILARLSVLSGWEKQRGCSRLFGHPLFESGGHGDRVSQHVGKCMALENVNGGGTIQTRSAGQQRWLAPLHCIRNTGQFFLVPRSARGEPSVTYFIPTFSTGGSATSWVYSLLSTMQGGDVTSLCWRSLPACIAPL